MNYFNDLYNDAYKKYKKEYADNTDFVLESNESAFEQLKPLYLKYKEKENESEDDLSICSEIVDMIQIEDNSEEVLSNKMIPIEPLHINKASSDKDNSFLQYSLSNHTKEDVALYKKAKKFIDSKIISMKSVNIKERLFYQSNIKEDFIEKDDFFKESLILLKNENNSFFDSSLLERLKLQYPNRIELLFFDIMRMLLIIKEAKKVNNITKIETICVEIETLYNLIISCLNTKVIYLTESSSVYIYQPVTLLKLWNNNSDDNDVSSYSELNSILFIKTLIKVKKIDKAFKYLKNLIDIGDSNISPLIFYYFGKVISLAITFRINTGVVGNFINQRSNYSIIKVAMISYSSEKTRNYIRLEKNYMRLAQISKFFKMEQDTIDNYYNKAKMYKEYINKQNKIY